MTERCAEYGTPLPEETICQPNFDDGSFTPDVIL
jgi:hypothetical protein